MLRILKELGNEHYKDIEDNVDEYVERMRTEDPSFHEQFLAEPTDNEGGMSTDQNIDEN